MHLKKSSFTILYMTELVNDLCSEDLLMQKTYTEEQLAYFEDMKCLKSKIDSAFKTEEKIMDSFAEQIQTFLYDTHGIDCSYMTKEESFPMRKKNSDKTYNYKMTVKCIKDHTQYMLRFDAPTTNNEKMSKATYTIQKLIENQEEYGYQIYINCCNFYANAKDTTIKSLANLHCLYCDLDGVPDVDFTTMTDREIQDFVAEKYSHVFSVIPFPNYITVSSQAGLHMYFLLNDYAINSCYGSNIETWKECGLGLQNLFDVPEFDKKICKDTQRILRLPGSINLKPNKMFQTRLIKCHDFRKSLKEMRSILDSYINVPARTPKKTKRIKTSVVKKSVKTEKVKRTKKVYTEKNFEFVNTQLSARLLDLDKWFVTHRNNMNGKRDIFFFILVNTMYYLHFSKDAIRKKVLRLNAMLPEPLSVSELENSILNYNKKYLIGNYKVAMYLEFTEEEKKSFEGRYVFNEKEYNKIAKRINNQKLTTKRKLERGVHNKKVKALLFVRKNGQLKNSTIAKTLDCSVRTAQRLRASVSKLFKKTGMTKMADAIKRNSDLVNIELSLESGCPVDLSLKNIYSQDDDYKQEFVPLLC